MLRLLQQFILTTLFAVFASQASAMFISPDPMNPTHPGVGTNRYAYSHDDPINMSDPSGLATVFSDRDGDGLNETATHFAPDSQIGRDLANGDWSSYRGWKSEWGGVRDNFRTLSGSQYASFTGSGFSGSTQHGDWLTVIRNSPESWALNGVSIGRGAQVGSLLARLNPAGLAATSVAAAEALGRWRTNITYVSTNPATGQVYLGRASRYGMTPQQVLAARWSGHHIRNRGFGYPVIDRTITGDYGSYNWGAVRGREQQLIDYFGGVGSATVANPIRGVARGNLLGARYHSWSNSVFGNIAPYTGY